jgi:hypothetical protein
MNYGRTIRKVMGGGKGWGGGGEKNCAGKQRENKFVHQERLKKIQTYRKKIHAETSQFGKL